MNKDQLAIEIANLKVRNTIKVYCDSCNCEINPVTRKSPLNIDHIDGDCTNNNEENLVLLCPNHHSLTPTYGSLNKGKSKRIKRYKVSPNNSSDRV